MILVFDSIRADTTNSKKKCIVCAQGSWDPVGLEIKRWGIWLHVPCRSHGVIGMGWDGRRGLVPRPCTPGLSRGAAKGLSLHAHKAAGTLLDVRSRDGASGFTFRVDRTGWMGWDGMGEGALCPGRAHRVLSRGAAKGLSLHAHKAAGTLLDVRSRDGASGFTFRVDRTG